MRICFFGNLQVIHLQRWVKYFVEKGHEVHIITREPYEIIDVHVHVFAAHSTLSFFYKIPIAARLFHSLYKYFEINRLKKLIDKINPDVINAHYLTNYGVFASKLDFHPFIITCWGSDILVAPGKFGEQHVEEMKKALTKADLITVESEYMNKSIEQLGINNRVEVVRHGVDLNKFNLDIETDTNLKQDIKSNDEIVIISTRNFEPVYNIQCVIEAFYLIQKKYAKIKLILLGKGSLEKQLKNLVNELNIHKKTLFLGHVPHEEIPKYYNLSDIYVSSSISDAMSVSKLEAMACGLIPVVSDIPANHEVIKDGENGFIFKNNPDDLSKKLNYCIEKYDDIKEKIIKSNLKIIKENFNWDKNMEEMEDVYHCIRIK